MKRLLAVIIIGSSTLVGANAASAARSSDCVYIVLRGQPGWICPATFSPIIPIGR